MDHLTKDHDQRPSVIDPDLRFADRQRSGMEVLDDIRDHHPLLKLLLIRGSREPDGWQTAIIHHQN